MAEEKKTTRTHKPRTPKVVKPVIEEKATEEVIEQPVEEVPEVEEKSEVQEVPETPVTEPEKQEDDQISEEQNDSTEEQSETPTEEFEPSFAEYSSSLTNGTVEVKKLNPNLLDTKSKWVAQIPYGNNHCHVIFKGSYAKALQAARNYNESRGLGSEIKKVRLDLIK